MIMRLPPPLLAVMSTTCLCPSTTLLRVRFPRGPALHQQHRAFRSSPFAASPLPSGGEELVQERDGPLISKQDVMKLPLGNYEGVVHWVGPPKQFPLVWGQS